MVVLLCDSEFSKAQENRVFPRDTLVEYSLGQPGVEPALGRTDTVIFLK